MGCGEALSVLDASVRPYVGHSLAWAAGGAGVVLLAVAARKFLPVVFLFSRLSKRDVEGHPSRAALLSMIRESPGVATAELSRRSSLAAGTLDHHLRTLEKAGVVKSLLVGRDRVWFEAGAKRPPLSERGSRAAILRAAVEEPGLSKTDLARRLDLALPTILHHVKKLEGSGAVVVERDGASMRVFPRFELRPPNG